jgi:mitochondrial GTPase 1
MAKASRDLAECVERADVVVEVRDARLPFSSSNPLLDAVSSGGYSSNGSNERDKPRVIVFNKADLADPQLQHRVTAAVAADAVSKRGGNKSKTTSLFLSADRGANIAALLKAIDSVSPPALFQRVAGSVVVVVGVPNCGKSSLINAMKKDANNGRDYIEKGSGGKASTAPTPGWTRSVSTFRVRKAPPLYVLDSPGVMPPRIPDVETGLKLAVTGAISAAASPPARIQVEFLLHFFEGISPIAPERVGKALGLSKGYTADQVDLCLEVLATRLGLLRKRNNGANNQIVDEPDIDAAAKSFLKSFQQGELGRYTMDFVTRESGKNIFRGDTEQ